MSIHKSLRTGGSLSGHRNVLSRLERIKILEEAGQWNEERNSVLGLRKVKSIKAAAKKKVKKEVAAETALAVPGAAGAAPAAGAAAPAAAGQAKPGAAKAAAPAAKPASKKPRKSTLKLALCALSQPGGFISLEFLRRTGAVIPFVMCFDRRQSLFQVRDLFDEVQTGQDVALSSVGGRRGL